MIRTLPAALCCLLVVSGCATVRDSSFNPLNWWGSKEARAADVTADGAPLQRVMLDDQTEGLRIAALASLDTDQIPGAIIIRAMGVADRQGYTNATLIPAFSEDSATLAYDFVVLPPDFATAVGPQRTREITAAVKISRQSLEGVKRIEVRSATNALQIRR